jgi:hypothetical protein
MPEAGEIPLHFVIMTPVALTLFSSGGRRQKSFKRYLIFLNAAAWKGGTVRASVARIMPIYIVLLVLVLLVAARAVETSSSRRGQS